MIPYLEINIGNFKVYNISGTSSLVVGKGNFNNSSSQSKTTNGVGNAYGDGSYMNMSPYKSAVNDPDIIDTINKKSNYYPYYYPVYLDPYGNPTYTPYHYPYLYNQLFEK
ncbi:hypothetical protein GH741_11000 [Aquibacillus halophilus]|uniref:Uncharacterized protein n=1 Tax=Aquibacillus halophilus TaxID=930132 RepID=A0A6A8DJQ2_9BACI|nr:hypothetical protein [Aquibacillus halophilus]